MFYLTAAVLYGLDSFIITEGEEILSTDLDIGSVLNWRIFIPCTHDPVEPKQEPPLLHREQPLQT